MNGAFRGFIFWRWPAEMATYFNFSRLLLAVHSQIFWIIKLTTDRLGIPFWDSAVCVQSHCQFAVY